MNVRPMERARGGWLGPITETVVLIAVLGLFWSLRSWNMENGDGEFCLKTVIDERPYAISLTRSTLTLLGFRGMYSVLNAWLGWWPSDAIALASCLGGVVFVAIGLRLGRRLYGGGWKALLPVVLPLSSHLLQVYCGEVEFYAWLNTALMVYAYAAWNVLQGRLNPVWASASLAIAAGCHVSGLFSIPSLLWLHILWLRNRAGHTVLSQPSQPDSSVSERAIPPRWKHLMLEAGTVFLVLAFLAITHRNRLWWFGPEPVFGLDIDSWAKTLSKKHLIYPMALFTLACAYVGYTIVGRRLAGHAQLERGRTWLVLLVPWLVFFSVRSLFGLHPEPILSHIAPFREPYDTISYLYMFISWDHLFDKLSFHLWSAPFGVMAVGYYTWRMWKREERDLWVLFLAGLACCALAWTFLFYPQLRTRDWDLFVSMGLPLNLILAHALATQAPGRWALTCSLAVVVTHLALSVPFVMRNAQFQHGRGYGELRIRSEIPAEVYVRGLRLGTTPFESGHVRSGPVEIRIVPMNRSSDGIRTTSQRHELHLDAGATVSFDVKRQDLLRDASEGTGPER